MQSFSRIQKALKGGKPSFGGWQMLPGTNHSRAMARSGLDWITIDCEHGRIADHEMHEAAAAIAACGVSPIVRIPANEPWMVKRALDAGAHGIVVPLIYTPADAERLVQSAKFPPVGTRGFGSPFPMQNFGNISITDYLTQANDALVTIVQIETREALESVETIAAIPGVDVLLIGPFDLGNNIGRPILTAGEMHVELTDAIQRIHVAAGKAGKRTGIYCTSGQQAREFADRGFHMISVAADMMALPAYFEQTLRVARGGADADEGEKPKGPYGG
ncbi:HpcH/HpaI aldolase/citrate lyase family protein [Pseudovirgaria hyperparasitica]|uniref:HpcH/HpaI aldolase/citrate lyase family protein n=1 Tax=Pseudovirgaria hyperparasitica TaxID=470096 RepID=A0A6A6WHH9_9PEZI|nr:HpcH/HpaI aldolase/citrate lyase family protein [Pseudovirgaria hyperparasitica]KAF2761530.1 HpcH/HpaI aldolase/citrate lyase family protein [Pseudovirgaria hyperparasitica]